MSLIKVSNLTFGYEGSFDDVFTNVSFMIDSNWKLGLVGRNGRGKTTFLNLLLGKYEYKGSISASVSFDYFPCEPTDENAVIKEIFMEKNPFIMDWEIEKELSLLDMEPDILTRNFNTLSHGERTKILLASLFLKENNFLLIDEPTNHLDILGKSILEKYLKNKKSFILVSHDRMFLDNSVDYIMSINKADIQIQKGNFSSFMENKERQDNFELAENEKLKKEISKLNESAKRTSGWSDKVEASKIGSHSPDRGFVGHKAAKMMKRSKAIEKRRNKSVEDKSKLLKNLDTYDKLSMKVLDYHSDIYLSFKDLSINYGDKTVFEGLSHTLRRGERLALSGKNGSGKSSLIKLIIGEDINYSGEFRMAKGLKISYINQSTDGLKGNLKEFANEQGIEESLFLGILRKLDFSRLQFEKNIEEYSQGQKKKVLIAKSLCEEAELFIWDEPLNYIDVFSRIQIEEVIKEYNPTLIFVDHDESFVRNIATDIIEF